MRFLPKKGQYFNAYTERYGNLHRAGPFKCTKIDGTHVYGIDKDGHKWNLQRIEFRFEARK